MGSIVKPIYCPFCYPNSILIATSPRFRKPRECPYCHRIFFYWKRRYYVCTKEIELIQALFKF
jgi:hypothetical protein